MKMTVLRKLQYAQQSLEKERAMREILQSINPKAFNDRKLLLEEAKRLHGKYNVHVICEALKIPRGTFYNHIFRSKGENNSYAIRDKMLKKEIQRIFDEHHQILGAAKIAAVIRQNGTPVTEKKVRKLMHELNLQSIRSKSKMIFNKLNPRYQNLVKRNFNPAAPNQVWVSDVTEFEFKQHKYFICAILDLFSRKIISHKIGLRNSTHLILITLRNAIKGRHPPKDMIFHSDRGSPYTAFATRRFCRESGINVSYSKARTPIDNAVMESFFSSLKLEELYRHNYHSVRAFYKSIDEYITYYNTARPHQKLGNTTPDQKEKSFNGGSKV
jgi:transposase InsO family protein